MKKQLRLLIALVIVGAVLGVLAYASAQYSAEGIRRAIDAIGEVTYSEESRALIDAADEALAAADPNLTLGEKAGNLATLSAAKAEYVRLAIKRMYIAIRDKQPEATIREYLSDAETAFSRYLTEADAGLVSNYKDLTDARAKYGAKAADNILSIPNIAPAQTVEIDLCGP
ncbi:MAG: hypothetical protein IJ240_10025 [Clostridia bacterium]|nr:hypothetical protein [Clostridia bacterium]